MFVLKLPAEIVSHIASWLSPHVRASTCRVCKAWYKLILSILYNSVTLRENAHIGQFSRAIAGDGAPYSSASTYIKSLTIRSNGMHQEKITEIGVALWVSCIPRLVHLRRLAWELPFVPNNLKSIKLLQTHCPQLESVRLFIPGSFDFTTKKGKSQYATFLEFKNMIEFVLEIECVAPEIDAEHLRPLKAITIRSPRLQVLELDFRNSYISPEHVAATLGAEFNLPFLRKIRLAGNYEPDPEDFQTPRGSHHFLDFLSRHTHLKDLVLECGILRESYDDIDPQRLAESLRSLEHFYGPYCLWNLLVHSTVATRLQSLVITSWELDGEDNSKLNASDLFLPALRKLDIRIQKFPKTLGILELLMPAAMGLEELRFPAVR